MDAFEKAISEYVQQTKESYDKALMHADRIKHSSLFSNKTELNISDAINVLIQYLEQGQNEGSYYYLWQANIAACIQNEIEKQTLHSNFHLRLPPHMQHSIANNAAKNFLNLLCSQPKIVEPKSR